MSSFASALLELSEVAQRTVDPALGHSLTRVLAVLHDEMRDQVTKAELRELQGVVADLAAAQRRTEQRVEELAAAQQRTEQRVEELAAAQRRTEQRLEELAAAQQRTEQRIEELAAAQQRTEQRLEELAAAQRRTDEGLATLAEKVATLAEKVAALADKVAALTDEVVDIRRELGGLSHAIGYGLENLAYRALPPLLRQELALEVEGRLVRRWLGGNGRPVQVNIWGLARRPDGKLVRVLGEAKTHLSAKKHFQSVDRLLERTRPYWEADAVQVVLVTHMAEPGTVEEGRRRGWLVVHSFELE